MNKSILFLLLITSIVSAKAAEPKIMRAHSNEHYQDYNHSSNHCDKNDEILSSSFETSAQITLHVSTEASSEITSEEHHGSARLSYLDNNRIQITQNIAQGQGEYIRTLLTLMELPNNEKSLKKLQKSFDELIYLSHSDFLDKIETLV